MVMANGSMMPPDVRAQLSSATKKRNGGGGIGSGAPENALSARARELAVNPDAAAETAEAEAAAAEDVREELKVCPSARCRTELKEEWGFCAKCGADLMRGGPAKHLGITFTEDDLQDYLFKGYVVRELKILGKHTVTLKTAQPKDVDAIDDYMINGDWSKNPDKSPRTISEFYSRQMQALCNTATLVQKIDGEAIGKTFTERMNYLLERGSAFVDLLGQRTVLFNQALTEYLKKADSILGS